MMKLSSPMIFAAMVLAFGCSNSPKAPEASTTPTPPATTPQKPRKPGLKNLSTKDIKIGDNSNLGVKIKGDMTVANGDMVTIQYTGKFADGKVFDTNTPTKGEIRYPLTFTVGAHQVVPGMEAGVVGMKVGGVRDLAIPSSLGYGPQQMGPIPANSDLYFNVKLLDMVKRGQEGDFDISDVVPGTGPKCKPGDSVTIKYTGRLADGQVFDAREHTFNLGVGEVVAGFDAAVTGMKVGGERNMRLPPAIAYGSKDIKGIPPNSTLYFNVKLLKIQ